MIASVDRAMDTLSGPVQAHPRTHRLNSTVIGFAAREDEIEHGLDQDPSLCWLRARPGEPLPPETGAPHAQALIPAMNPR